MPLLGPHHPQLHHTLLAAFRPQVPGGQEDPSLLSMPPGLLCLERRGTEAACVFHVHFLPPVGRVHAFLGSVLLLHVLLIHGCDHRHVWASLPTPCRGYVLMQRTDRIVAAERVLEKLALVAIVVGNRLGVSRVDISGAICSRLDLRPDEFSVHRLQDNEFLLSFPNANTRGRVAMANIQACRFCLILQPSSRLARVVLFDICQDRNPRDP
ncbi:hypothetical protein ZWY2020_040348 [Hordeum vulgare]|nr:hypothetical protein ZWY2020_040348 [Hordeum vulgare]